MFDVILGSINYVISAPFFYPSMGMTAATSIMLGGAMYNGDIKPMWKGVIGIGVYAVFLIFINITRILDQIGAKSVPIESQYMAYAGTVTVFFLTIWYILGIIIGVYRIKMIHKKMLPKNLTK